MPLPNGLRLVTWNIHGCIGLDRRYRPDRICRALEDMEADIYALQEVDDRRPRHRGRSQFAYLRHGTGLNGAAGPNIRGELGEYGNAILTRWPIKSVRRVDLSFHKYEPRGALDVDLEGPEGPLRVVNVHLGLRRAERVQQIEWLLAAMAEHPEEGVPLVLLGDFNEWSLAAGHRLAAVIDRFPTVFAPKTFPALLPIAPLDRIYIDPRPAEAAGAVCTHRSVRYSSDHLPVIADIQWAPVRERSGRMAENP